MTMFDSSWGRAAPERTSRLTRVKKSRQGKEDAFSLAGRTLSDSSMLMRNARRQLRDIGAIGALGDAQEELSQWTFELLRQIANNSTVYPAIAPDYSGGLALHWVANHLSLEIEVDADRTYSFVAYNHDKIVASGEGVGQPPVEKLRSHLTLLTRYVEVNNPEWRVSLDQQ